MASKKNAQRITFISAIITLISFLYKLVLTYLTRSQILLIASISTFMIFICKALFVKNVNKTRDKKKHAYFVMMLALFIYTIIFVGIIILKMNGIDMSNSKTYEGLYGAIFIIIMLVMFIMSFLGLRGALDKTDLMVIGLKEMTFASALTDLIIIEEFASRVALDYVSIPHMDLINSIFGLVVCALIIMVALKMLVRFFKYKEN